MSTPTRGRGLHRSPLFFHLLLASALALSPIGCSPDEASRADASSASAAPTHSSAEQSPNTPNANSAHVQSGDHKKKAEKAARHPNERPIPAFEGTTVAGTKIAMRDFLGARAVLFFVNPEVKDAVAVSTGVRRLAALSGDHNFRIVGIGVGSDAATVGRFAKEQGFSFPMIDDSSGAITKMLRLQSPIALLGSDADGYVTFGLGSFPQEADVDVADWTEEQLRKQLRIEETRSAGVGALDTRPQAPDLGVVAMSNGDVLETKDLEGRAAIVIFFLHTCPHCHNALAAIKESLASIPEADQPRLVAISVQNSPTAIRSALTELGLDFFDPYLDPGDKAAKRWGVTGGVPVVTVLDKEGRILHRTQGWNGQRDAGLLRMYVARASGVRVPMLLDGTGYSGNDVCGVCHEQEYATWQYTKHATAFNTLVTHAADRRTDCVGCHVVGFEETGGYDFTHRPAHLENVGCESCHGRGGPHLSPGFVKNAAGAVKNAAGTVKNAAGTVKNAAGTVKNAAASTNTASSGSDYAPVCGTCHNPTHSLGFDYESFHPKISHTQIAALPNNERALLLEGGGPARNLLPTQSDYVGSNACQSCHTKEFETWQASPHGHAVATLEVAGKSGDADCLRCHTTAYDEPGGFRTGVPAPQQPDLARVGCESCHGPGGDHIGENAKRVGTILSLGDKCDSCVILRVCGSCHDSANDAGFEFKVEGRIEAQRHGTIESAATRAGESAFRVSPHATPLNVAAHDRALLRDAFDVADDSKSTPSATGSPSAPPDPS